MPIRIVKLFLIVILFIFSQSCLAQSSDMNIANQTKFSKFEFPEAKFTVLYNSIINRKKLEAAKLYNAESKTTLVKMLGHEKEIRDLSLRIDRINLNFSQIDSLVGSKALYDSYQIGINFDKNRKEGSTSQELIRSLQGEKTKFPPLTFYHDKVSKFMPSAGLTYSMQNDNIDYVRLAMFSEGDSQMAIFIPKQVDHMDFGFMLCPRMLGKVANSMEGKYLEKSNYELSSIELFGSAEASAKVLDGFDSDGFAYLEVGAERNGEIDANDSIKDFNEGAYPEALAIYSPNSGSISQEFIKGKINELGIRINAEVRDSGQNAKFLNLSSGVAIKEVFLNRPEPINMYKQLYSVRSGQCYLIYKNIDALGTFVAGKFGK